MTERMLAQSDQDSASDMFGRGRVMAWAREGWTPRLLTQQEQALEHHPSCNSDGLGKRKEVRSCGEMDRRQTND